MNNVKQNKIKNLTPHAVTLVTDAGKNITINSDGVIRVSENTETIGTIEGIRIIKKQLNEVSKNAIVTI